MMIMMIVIMILLSLLTINQSHSINDIKNNKNYYNGANDDTEDNNDKMIIKFVLKNEPRQPSPWPPSRPPASSSAYSRGSPGSNFETSCAQIRGSRSIQF